MTTVLRIAILAGLASIALAAQGGVAGEWMVTLHEQFGPSVQRLVLAVSGETLSGTLGRRKVEGTVKDGSIEFKLDNASVKGMLAGDELKGEAVFSDRTVKWTAVRIAPRPAVSRTHDFAPTEFQRYFSSAIKPVLRINPGDSVRTWAVDAGGRDKEGKPRSGGGNPQTGPFYVEGVVPNDTLVVRLTKVRTNRNWAGSGSTIMRTALEPGTLGNLKWATEFPGRWTIDAATNVAFLEKPTDLLKGFEVPLQPMVGCVAVAPAGESSIRTTDSGRFGGNMDYNQIREGTTIYLPVSHPGALLFVGDGHAAQGDGEVTGTAIETSLSTTLQITLRKKKPLRYARIETPTHMITIGLDEDLDEAARIATREMIDYLVTEKGLTRDDAYVLCSAAVDLRVSQNVDVTKGVHAMLAKALFR